MCPDNIFELNPPYNIGSQGWSQFLTAKKEMLCAIDFERERNSAYEIKTSHGNIAEAKFREWLSSFLPKRYGVTSGYIVCEELKDKDKLPHYDVIIYDTLASPVLWTEDNPDKSNKGRNFAIPAKHVYGVIEVKSSFTGKDAKNAIKHLLDLRPLFPSKIIQNNSYKNFLPKEFFCAAVFFELRERNKFSKSAINNAVPDEYLYGYFGGLILRGDNLRNEVCGKVCLTDRLNCPSNVGRAKNKSSLLDIPISDAKKIDGREVRAFINWKETSFASFAFNLITIMQGIPEDIGFRFNMDNMPVEK